MKYKKAMEKELKKAKIDFFWFGSSIRIGTELMIRFYPDYETYELMMFKKTFSGQVLGWQSMAKTNDTYTILLVLKAQMQLINMGLA